MAGRPPKRTSSEKRLQFPRELQADVDRLMVKLSALDQDDERSLKYDIDHLVVLLGFLSEKLTEEINRK
jgi:hypothetical protein